MPLRAFQLGPPQAFRALKLRFIDWSIDGAPRPFFQFGPKNPAHCYTFSIETSEPGESNMK